MAKIPDCDRCRFYAHTPYLVCTVHPTGPDDHTCADFAPDPPLETRRPLGGGYYAGDWIPQPFPTPRRETQHALLDWHPIFTGRCPACEMPIPPPELLCDGWNCTHCGWHLSAYPL